MRFSSAVALSAFYGSANAFTDSSPFVLFSSSAFSHTPSDQPQLQSSSAVVASAKDILSSCSTDRYLLVSQPNLNAVHLRTNGAAPRFRAAFDNEKVQARFSVSEVVGSIDIEILSEFIKTTCRSRGPYVESVVLSALPRDGSSESIKSNDDELDLILAQYEMEGSYTVIYTGGHQPASSESQFKIYNSDFQDTVHMPTKRQLGQIQPRQSNRTSNAPLFERYEFLNPGIFMGLIVVAVLLSILGAGLSAISSLEVSYGAFDKEMGPAAQKKQQ